MTKSDSNTRKYSSSAGAPSIRIVKIKSHGSESWQGQESMKQARKIKKILLWVYCTSKGFCNMMSLLLAKSSTTRHFLNLLRKHAIFLPLLPRTPQMVKIVFPSFIHHNEIGFYFWQMWQYHQNKLSYSLDTFAIGEF